MTDIPRPADVPAGHSLWQRPDEPVRAVLSLGANLGDREARLAEAVREIAEHPDNTVVAVSPLAETQPVGVTEQPEFLNQILILTTQLAPLELLELAQDCEERAQRVRTQRWGPRTLDVDIITYGELTSDHPVLTLPHPRAQERGFVLVPWEWADASARLNGVPVGEWAAKTADATSVRRVNNAETPQQESRPR